MTERVPAWVSATTWALCLLLVAAALVLGPVYLVHEAGAGRGYEFSRMSYAWSREVLAVVHVVFLVGMLACAMSPVTRRLVGRMTGVSALVGIWEVLLSVAAMFLAEGARFAPPNMTVTALGALLLLGGTGLNLDVIIEKLTSPKAPVIAVFTVASLGGAVAFGLIGALNVRHYARVDYTRAERYSLAPATRELLAGLGKTVRITTLFVARGPGDHALRQRVTDVLDEYDRVSGRLEVEHIDVHRQKRAATRLVRRLVGRGIQLEENSVIFECPETGRTMKVARHEMIETVGPKAARGETAAGDERPRFRFIADSIFHQVMSIVTTTRTLKLYFVVGHGEKPKAIGPRHRGIPVEEYKELRKAFPIELFEQGLRRRYFGIKTLDLDEDIKEGEGIPADCDVLVIAGPWCRFMADRWGTARARSSAKPFMAPFSKRHATLVGKYIDRGGRAFIMVDPVGRRYEDKVRPLLSLLRRYGVDVGVERYVMDEIRQTQQSRYGGKVERLIQSFMFMAELAKDYRTAEAEGKETMEFHPSVSALGTRPTAVMFSAAIKTRPHPRLRHTALLVTSKDAWLHNMTARRVDPAKEERARRILAVAVEQKDTGRPVMVVLGCSNMFIQPMLRFERVADNEAFGQKVLAWLAGSAGQLGIEPKPAELTDGHAARSVIRTVRFVSVLLIPSTFLLVGALIWLGRRR